MEQSARARRRELNTKLRRNMDALIAALQADDGVRAGKIRASVTPAMLEEAFVLDAEYDLDRLTRFIQRRERAGTPATDDELDAFLRRP